MRSFYLVLGGLTLVGSACTKADPQASLPRISQEGLNTGGFLVDGIAYPATGWPGTLLGTGGPTGALEGGYARIFPGFPVRPTYELRINSEQATKYVVVTLFLRNPSKGEFVLNRNTGLPPTAVDSTIFDHATIDLGGGKGELYTTSARHTGRIILSNASRPTLSAGTFEFTAVSNLDPAKTVRVTAGRFDRKQ
ncbi:hypothetical protein [Hymenobacter bucti]|uniref:Uncharacterized protein n=1 Tax=Hymenobacter bucti TaxID=1844114 RepID=A0ABW4R0V7_9BACT